MARVKDLWFNKTGKKTKRHGKGKRWQAVWVDTYGRERTKTFRYRDAARKYADQMEADVERGEYVDPSAGRETFETVFQTWLELRNVGAGTKRKYRSGYECHIRTTFGDRYVSDIRPSDVLRWLRNVKGSAPLREQVYHIVASTLDLAVADKMIKENPARSKIVEPPRREPPTRTVWSDERVHAVLGAHPERYRAIAYLAAATGMRINEIFGVGAEDINLNDRVLYVRRQIQRVGREWYFKLPKYGKTRVVPLSEGMTRMLRDHMEAYPPEPYTLPWMTERDGVDGECTIQLMFRWSSRDPRSNGRHINCGCYTPRVWKPALAEAGVIPRASAGGGYAASREDGMHALRHWLTTMLMDERISLASIMDILGHSRKGAAHLSITVSTYSHPTEASYDDVRTAVDRRLFSLHPALSCRPIGKISEKAS